MFPLCQRGQTHTQNESHRATRGCVPWGNARSGWEGGTNKEGMCQCQVGLWQRHRSSSDSSKGVRGLSGSGLCLPMVSKALRVALSVLWLFRLLGGPL